MDRGTTERRAYYKRTGMYPPERCMRDGIPCAFRTKFTGGYGSSACGYLFFTNERRNCSVWDCDKWAEELPEGLDDESDADEDIPDCNHSAEYSGSYDVLLAEGY